MDTISYYRLRKIAAVDRTTTAGEIGAGLIGGAAAGGIGLGLGTMAGTAGATILTELVNRLRGKDAFYRARAARTAASVGALGGGALGAIGGAYAGQRLGRDLYGKFMDKRHKLTQEDADEFAKMMAEDQAMNDKAMRKYFPGYGK